MKSYVMKIQQHTHSDAAKLILYQNKAYEVIVQGEIYNAQSIYQLLKEPILCRSVWKILSFLLINVGAKMPCWN